MTAPAPPEAPAARVRGGSQEAGRRVAERRREALRAAGRGRRRRLGWALALAIGLVVCIAAVRSPLFGLSRVVVVGARHESPAEVVRAAGVRLGEPLLALDLGALAARVERLPWVRRVTVQRLFPSGITIVLSERRPAASVVDAAGGDWLVAADGTVLAQVPAAPSGLPVLGGIPITSTLAPGDRLSGAGAYGNALTALAGLGPQLGRLVVAVRAPSVDGLTFTLRGGIQLAYGAAQDAPAKDAAALLMLDQAAAEHRRPVRIDVRSPSTPTLLVRCTLLGTCPAIGG